jgi:hypothetical protein
MSPMAMILRPLPPQNCGSIFLGVLIEHFRRLALLSRFYRPHSSE